MKLRKGIDTSKIELRKKSYETIIINNFRYQELEEFFNKLQLIPYAVVKGEALSLQAYSEKGWRKSQDIDVLVSRENLPIVEKSLTESGFQQYYLDERGNMRTLTRKEKLFYITCSHQIYPYIKTSGVANVTIDINFDIFWGQYAGYKINIDEFCKDTVDTVIYGVKVKLLKPIKAFIHLCLHHYKEFNSIFLLLSHNYFNIQAFQDIYYLLKNNQNVISINNLFELSSKYHIIPYIYYILYYTNEVFDDSMLYKYVERFKTAEGEELLECYGLTSTERKKWNVPFYKRLNANNVYEYMKNSLSVKDIYNYEINKRFFGKIKDL